MAEPAVLEAEAPSAKHAASKLARRTAQSKVKLTWRGNGSIESATGFVSRSYAGNRTEAARAFIEEHRELFGSLPAQTLRPMHARQLGPRAYVRLQQHLDGIPIRGAEVTLRFNNANAVQGVNARLEPQVERGGAWQVDDVHAIRRAVAAHGGSPSDPPSATKWYVLRERRAHPVWRIVLRSADPAGDWEYIVSAEDGRILERQNLRVGQQSTGYAYPRNPVRGDRERVALENLVSDRLLSSQTRVLTYFPALKGQVSPGTAVPGALRQNGHFLYDADDARASEVQLYWGMETAAARFRALGFEAFAEPLPGVVFFQDWDADKKQFTGADNAFFSPVAFGEGKGGMFFYLTSKQGDTSLDTDVIFHEYAHAVINELVGPRQSTGFKALNEGTADYFANSFLDDPVMAEYAAKIFSLRTPFLRRSDNEHSWPYSTVGEVHADGNIWSGALWDVRRMLGASAADEIAINAIAMLSPDSEFFDAATAAILAAEEIYGEDAAETVATIMEDRGIFTRAAETASDARWMETGATAGGSIPAARPGYLLVGEQQYRIEVPHRATKLLVRVNAEAAVRFYIRYRVPVTVEDGRIRAEQMSDIQSDPAGYLSLENTPELQAGIYYVAVVNASTIPVSYAVQIEVEGGETAAPPALTFLSDGESASGSAPSGPFLASRQFAIQVPEGVSALAVTLEGDKDVDLYVRVGRLVAINGTGYPEADLVSNSAESREDLRITAASGGLLPAGVYVVAVYNYSPATTRFHLRARLER